MDIDARRPVWRISPRDRHMNWVLWAVHRAQ